MRGGKRPGAGRKKGSINKVNALRQEMVAASGETPLDCLLSFMRAPQPVQAKGESAAAFQRRWNEWQTYRFEAARAAAPYVHPKLAAVEHRGEEDLRSKAIQVIFVQASAPHPRVITPAVSAPSQAVGATADVAPAVPVRSVFVTAKPEARKEKWDV
jgi:hypothetical protein